MMNFAYREGLGHISKLNFRKLKVDMKEEVRRRGIFSLQEYDDLVRFLRTYSSKKECQDETERLERLLVRDSVLIASNTMLRVGELWNLKWGDIADITQEIDNQGRSLKLVTLNVRAEIAKTGRRRQVVSRGGEYFERLKERAKYTRDNDYVFSSVNGRSKFTRQKWYLHWKNLMRGIGIDYKKRNITWYSLRHFGITCRLRADVSVYDVSEMAGTSVVNIQNHYGHIDTDMLKRAALKNFSVDKTGFVEI
jgi:integrase